MPPDAILVCAPDHAGTLNQALGVAEALGRALTDRGGTVPVVRRYRELDVLMARLPKRRIVAVSCGQSGERKGRRLKTAGRGVFWVHIETLKFPGARPDLTIVPAHDWIPEFDGLPDVLRVQGVPHRIRADTLARMREVARNRLALGPEDRANLFLIGGPNEAFDYDEAALNGIVQSLRAISLRGERGFVVTSRRTPERVKSALRAIKTPAVTCDDGSGRVSYGQYLAAADAVFVAEDSISMSCEALATGRPVFLLRLTGKSGVRLDKFRRFQRRFMGEYGVPRFFDGAFDEGREYFVPDDAGRVAAAILTRLQGGGSQ